MLYFIRYHLLLIFVIVFQIKEKSSPYIIIWYSRFIISLFNLGRCDTLCQS